MLPRFKSPEDLGPGSERHTWFPVNFILYIILEQHFGDFNQRKREHFFPVFLFFVLDESTQSDADAGRGSVEEYLAKIDRLRWTEELRSMYKEKYGLVEWEASSKVQNEINPEICSNVTINVHWNFVQSCGSEVELSVK